MKVTIIIISLFGIFLFFAMPFIAINRGTKKNFDRAEALLQSGGSLDSLEALIGPPKHDWDSSNLPDYVLDLPEFQQTPDSRVRGYDLEGLPYWWVHVQFRVEDSEVTWYSVAWR